MKKFEILGGDTIFEYRSTTIEANTEDEALRMFNEILEFNSFAYFDWEISDIKQANDFEFILINEISN